MPVALSGAGLHYGDGVIFSAVNLCSPDQHGIDDLDIHSELEFLALEEIRFLACVSLALRPDRGMIYTYPLPVHLDTPDERAGSTWIRDQAFELAQTLRGRRYASSASAFLPLSGGPPYDHHDEWIDADILRSLTESAALTDHLLMRGFGALIRADMLWQHLEFADAATMTLHVALEVSYQLVLRRLRSEGLQNPSAVDAGAFIDDAFNPHFETAPYFHEYYQDRIRAVHPTSRFGTYPFAPLSADSYFDLRSDLHSVFLFLVTGKKWPDLWA